MRCVIKFYIFFLLCDHNSPAALLKRIYCWRVNKYRAGTSLAIYKRNVVEGSRGFLFFQIYKLSPYIFGILENNINTVTL